MVVSLLVNTGKSSSLIHIEERKTMAQKSEIFGLSWNEDSFFAKLRLVIKSEKKTFSRRSFKLLAEDLMFGKLIDNPVDLWSNLSSTYYSVAGSSFVKIRKIFSLSDKNFGTVRGAVADFFRPLTIPFWLLLGGYCFLRMFLASNRMLKIAGGYQRLTAEQCDVRQSILRKWRKWSKAYFCVNYGLTKNPSDCTLALLKIGALDIALRRAEIGKGEALADILYIASLADSIEKENPQQAGRILRHCGKLLERIGEDGSRFYNKSRQILEQVGAKDQLLKMS